MIEEDIKKLTRVTDELRDAVYYLIKRLDVKGHTQECLVRMDQVLLDTVLSYSSKKVPLHHLTLSELSKLAKLESSNKNRKTVLNKIDAEIISHRKHWVYSNKKPYLKRFCICGWSSIGTILE